MNPAALYMSLVVATLAIGWVADIALYVGAVLEKRQKLKRGGR